MAHYTLEILFCIYVFERFRKIKESCKIVAKIRYSITCIAIDHLDLTEKWLIGLSTRS